MTRDEAIATFKVVLADATAQITEQYFHLPIDGSDKPIYRERVYCYELYHQIRNELPEDFPYSLGGEVDKSGHPLFRDGPLKDSKPDLLVHSPGDMAGNLIVIEVKPINAPKDQILQDLESITQFISVAHYDLGIMLLYGNKTNQLDALLETIIAGTRSVDKYQFDVECIDIWWHPNPETKASCIMSKGVTYGESK